MYVLKKKKKTEKNSPEAAAKASAFSVLVCFHFPTRLAISEVRFVDFLHKLKSAVSAKQIQSVSPSGQKCRAGRTTSLLYTPKPAKNASFAKHYFLYPVLASVGVTFSDLSSMIKLKR